MTSTAKPETLKEQDGSKEKLSLQGKLNAVYEGAGFMPTSSVELTEALGIMAVSKKIGGPAKHLAEVARHQEKAGQRDNHRATRKIVHLYTDWGTDALRTLEEFEQLEEATHLVNPHLKAEVAEIESSTPGVLGLVRHHDITVLQRGGSDRQNGYRIFGKNAIDWSRDNSAIMVFVDAKIAQWTVRDITSQLPEAVQDQRQRHEFFLSALEQVSEHYPQLRQLAEQGIRQVSDVPPVQ